MNGYLWSDGTAWDFERFYSANPGCVYQERGLVKVLNLKIINFQNLELKTSYLFNMKIQFLNLGTQNMELKKSHFIFHTYTTRYNCIMHNYALCKLFLTVQLNHDLYLHNVDQNCTPPPQVFKKYPRCYNRAATCTKKAGPLRPAWTEPTRSSASSKTSRQ